MAALKEYGYNPRSTPYKQFALDQALGHLLGSSVRVARQSHTRCIVCDMTAGPGCDPNGNEGSPLIFARHINGWRMQGYDVALICVERNAGFLTGLRTRLSERYPDLAVEYFSSQSEALARIPKRAVGLTYWDPTRYNDLDRDLLLQFGRSHSRMDILITRECLAGYRMQRAAHCVGTLTIQDYLALTGKRCAYIQQYAKHGWWSLGFADNWVTRPTKKLRGFHNVQSEAGQRELRKWTNGMQAEEVAQDVPEQIEEQTLWQTLAG